MLGMHTVTLELLCQIHFIEGWGAFVNHQIISWMSWAQNKQVSDTKYCAFGKFSNVFEMKTCTYSNFSTTFNESSN